MYVHIYKRLFSNQNYRENFDDIYCWKTVSEVTGGLNFARIHYLNPHTVETQGDE
jgi:hypothetical protein